MNNGDSSLKTGNANTTGSIVNSVNSNLAGASVSEFNINDDHHGDYVLDFAANCVSGCGDGGLNTVANTGNGADSTNTASSSSTNNNTTNQNNSGDVTSNMTLSADSGNNTASYNTNGDSSIQTGDANVAANILNFVNNNLAGKVVLGVVNIFGNLVGDIIMPDMGSSSCTSSCSGSTSVANNNNGAGSTNTASSNTTNNDNTFQNNDATIENNLTLGATTGANNTSYNTGGGSAVTTGDSSTKAQVVNVANTNTDGGNVWLVIVNKAGQWIGKILGAPDGATTAGSEGTEITVDPNGQVTATNSGNGAGSTNSTTNNQTNNNTTNQNNTAHIVNNLDLSANTGGNNASYNTGGNSNISTGDAKVIANIINFVNNNITGKGKLVVTFVNVFGSWVGDLVTPGQKKDHSQQSSQPTNNVSQQSNNTASSDTTSQNTLAAVTDNAQTNNQGANTLSLAPQQAQGTTYQPSFSGNTGSVEGANTTLVKSAGTDAGSTLGDSRKVITINLAWLIVFAPLIGLLFLGRKILIRKYRV